MVGVGVVLVAALGVVNVARDSSERVVVNTAKVGRSDLVASVSAFGEVKPRLAVNIGANVSGRIVALPVVEGQTVKRGQLLARIEAEEFQAAVRHSEAAWQSARADLERAEAETDIARLNHERLARIRDSGLVSQQELDQVQADLRMKVAARTSAERRVTQAAATLDSHRNALRKTVVEAPIDGVVTSLVVEQGEMVIGAQSFSPTVLMTVSDLSIMEVELRVDESDIASVALQQEASVRVDALPATQLVGHVTQIGASAVTRDPAGAAQGASGQSSRSKDFRVVVTLVAPPAAVRPGVNATAEITTARRARVLAVPTQALVVRRVDRDGRVADPDSGGASPDSASGQRPSRDERDGVFVVAGGRAVFRPVKTGILGESQIEIVEGLKDGEEVVVGSYRALRELRDNARVKIETRRTATASRGRAAEHALL